ncbi:MAG: hypothetical protein WCX61_05035, partial [Candidatus Peribacteraceae bacterium]
MSKSPEHDKKTDRFAHDPESLGATRRIEEWVCGVRRALTKAARVERQPNNQVQSDNVDCAAAQIGLSS